MSLLFVDHYIVVAEVLIGKSNYILLLYLRKVVDVGYLVSPIEIVGKGIHKHIGSAAITFRALDNSFLNIIYNRRYQVVVEIAFFQILYFV